MPSKLWFFNFFFMQFFFIRLARVMEDGKQVRWTIIGPVLPLTGWWSDFIYLRRMR